MEATGSVRYREAVSWSTLRGEVGLGPADVQVWRASLDAGPDARARLRALLTDDERGRADRFVFERDRDRFTVARAFLREVLARHLGIPADRVRFSVQPAGKPLVEGARLRFNLSHSGDLALLAVTLDREIGVDLEALRPLRDAGLLAERHFAPGEIATLGSLPAAARDAAFLRCWTLKEAYVKGVGGGLSIPLDAFEVDYEPVRDEPALRVLDPPGDTAWTLRTLDPGPGYVGALAVQGSGFRLERVDWFTSRARAAPSR
jgi:4'-phosphopantetheinyl transferase